MIRKLARCLYKSGPWSEVLGVAPSEWCLEAARGLPLPMFIPEDGFSSTF